MENLGTLRAGVIGWPISHSLSPRLHGFWLKEYGVDGVYEPIAVEQKNLEKTIKSLRKKGYAGVNVTVPHKECVLNYIDEIDNQAQRIGAVNTIVVRSNGSLFGLNTDSFGFLENIKTSAPKWSPSDGPAVVIGAGGAARAICAALIDNGVPEIRLFNRTQTRAEILSQHIGGPIIISPWTKLSSSLNDAALLVNTTTLGMVGKPLLELDISNLPINAVVNDIVYTPLETPLLKKAKDRGNLVVDGLGMLLHQARPGFAAWFGIQPEVTDKLRSYVLRGVD